MSDVDFRISGAVAPDLTVDEIRELNLQTMAQGIGYDLRVVSNVPLSDTGDMLNEDTIATGSFMVFHPQGWEAGKWHNRGATLTDGEWTMVANTLTLDSPFPVPGEDKNYGLGLTPPFVTQSDNSVIYSGHRYTFNEPCWVRTLRVWVTELTPDTNYRVVVIRQDPGKDPVTSILEEPILAENEWKAVSAFNALLPIGAEVLIYIDGLNSGGTNTVTGGWTFSGQENVAAPPRGGWNHDNSNTILRIDKFDLDGTDRTSELDGLIANTTIQFVNTDNPAQTDVYRVRNAPVDSGTYYTYDVTLENQTGGGNPVGTTTMTADVPIPQPTQYAEVAGSVPSFTQNVTVEGFLQFNGADQGGAANSYGVDIEVESVIASPDWDILAYNPLT